jgi:hypothetical protein
MSGFSATWLALREPHDARARNAEVLAAVTASFKQDQAIHITDLACGTGSTMRALSPLLDARQEWRLVDNDIALLSKAEASRSLERVAATAVALDLNHSLDVALERPIDLVTTSALLDLVSDTWLERLAAILSARSIPFYAALSYDGRIELTPSDPCDAAIIAAINAHQRTDKGFGPALGPAAANFAVTHFQSHGYSLARGNSDWLIGSDDCEMQLEVLSGWANAAADTGMLTVTDTDAWLTRRRDAVAAGLSSIRVGHVDVFAAPIRTR